MPRELSSSEEREYNAYLALGSLEDVKAKLGKLPKVQQEAADRRKEVEAVTAERDALKAKVPDGAVVLTGDEAKSYGALQTAGKTLKSLSDDQGELETLRQKDAARTREDGWRKAARAEGYDPDKTVKALGKLNGFGELPFEVKQEKTKDARGERTDEVGYVTVDGKSVRLGEYLKEHADFVIPGITNGGGHVPDGRREIPEMRGGGAGSRNGPPSADDYRKATEGTANYVL